jgi:hypothetical protein
LFELTWKTCLLFLVKQQIAFLYVCHKVESGYLCYLELDLEQDLVKNKSPALFEDKYYNEEFTIQLPSQKKITDIKWLAGITLTVAFLSFDSGKFRGSGSGRI